MGNNPFRHYDTSMLAILGIRLDSLCIRLMVIRIQFRTLMICMIACRLKARLFHGNRQWMGILEALQMKDKNHTKVRNHGEDPY